MTILLLFLLANQSRDMDLTTGVLAVRGHMKHVTPPYAEKVVAEAKRQARGRWFTPALLLGLAINESDLRQLKRGYDCGITQVRVTNHSRTRSGRKALCDKLVEDMTLAFRLAVEELEENKARYCRYWWAKAQKYRRYRWKFLRCVLNTYNQGPFYYREETCHGSRRCVIKSRYWLRVVCFATAVANGTKANRCRRAPSLRWIRKHVGEIPPLLNF